MVDRLGDDGLPMPHNSSIPTIGPIVAKPKSKSRLIADLDPDEWELPPKPKGMRWPTYNRLIEKFDSYEEVLERG